MQLAAIHMLKFAKCEILVKGDRRRYNLFTKVMKCFTKSGYRSFVLKVFFDYVAGKSHVTLFAYIMPFIVLTLAKLSLNNVLPFCLYLQKVDLPHNFMVK